MRERPIQRKDTALKFDVKSSFFSLESGRLGVSEGRGQGSDTGAGYRSLMVPLITTRAQTDPHSSGSLSRTRITQYDANYLPGSISRKYYAT